MRRIGKIRSGSLMLVAALLCGEALTAAPITELRDMLNLPLAAVATKPSVHVRAVVTCVDKGYQMVFVQDATGGALLVEKDPGLALTPGDELDIHGLAARGLFSPFLEAQKITIIGKTNLPPCRPLPLTTIISSIFLHERVETDGVVQRVTEIDNHLFLTLGAGENRCLVSIPLRPTDQRSEMIDSRVRVRGVAMGDAGRHKQTGVQLVVNGLADVEIIAQPPIDAFRSPVCPLNELSRFYGRRAGEHRVHARGIVTYHSPGRATIIQDPTGGALIEKGLSGSWKRGDDIEVAGFLTTLGTGNRLRNAEARRMGTTSEPRPVPLTLADAETRDNTLGKFVGRVVEWQPPLEGEAIAIVSSSNELFAVMSPESSSEYLAKTYPPDSIIDASGIVKAVGADTRGTPRTTLWLRDLSDIRLVAPPPTSPWKWVWRLGIAVSLLTTAGATLFAIIMIRHRRVVAQMSVRQNEVERQFEETERQLHRSHRDREHIAQELHDNIIQSIYSVGLGIDEAIRLAQKSPDRVQERLNVAVQSLNGLIRDVRSFLVGLEPKGLEGHELKAALKSVLLTSGEDQQSRFSIQIDANAARDLNSIQATEVFSIAKEAMSNSMRHAHAPLTKVLLVPYGRGVRLEVVDDGVGFDPAQVIGGSLGLRNLRNRARNIGAQLEIISAPGQGTRILVDIPLSAHDDH